ncbi:Rieske domain-containing protein [Brachionichthys hirsutus]|uniref:Rieske domain-containing protein n=1 Tax=Brachionichthys hirsutus TaxID=412623 RepID=UPI003604DD84
MEVKKQPSGGPHFVGKKDELIAEKRAFRTLEGRDILIIHHQDVFYAIDCYCYHNGGLLQNGDIEEINGKLCIICPNHKYKITLAEGEGIYKATDPREAPPVARWLSKGQKQRIHAVTQINGDVYVELSDNRCTIESDYYQGEKGKVARAKAEASDGEMPVTDKTPQQSVLPGRGAGGAAPGEGDQRRRGAAAHCGRRV